MMNLDFYQNLPKKECKACGCEIEEMHESYLDECVSCSGVHVE